jgi:hypothetical protein
MFQLSPITRLIGICADRSAIAALEFAIAAPVLMFLGLGGIEAANESITNMRLSMIAMQVAQNLARVPASIDETDVVDALKAAELSGQTMSFQTRGRLIASSVEENETSTGQYIRWQRCIGSKIADSAYGNEGDGKTDARFVDGVGATGRKISAPAGSAVIMVEVLYDYHPIIPWDLWNVATLSYEAAFNVRERIAQDISNNSDLADHERNLCTAS